MRCLWDLSIKSPLRETSQRPLRKISKETSFFVTSLRHLKYISKKMSFCDGFKTSQMHLKKDVFHITSLSHLKHISKKCLFCGASDTSQKYLLEVFVTIQKYPTKVVSCWKNRCEVVKYQWANVCMLFILVVRPTNHLVVLTCQQSSNLSSRCTI